jgi:hypothetical protein
MIPTLLLVMRVGHVIDVRTPLQLARCACVYLQPLAVTASRSLHAFFPSDHNDSSIGKQRPNKNLQDYSCPE